MANAGPPGRVGRRRGSRTAARSAAPPAEPRRGSVALSRASAAAVNVGITQPGELFAMTLDTARAGFRRPFQWREFIQQAWFIVSVTVLPTMMVSIPFGAILALQMGSLVEQLGAQSFTGATAVVAIVREASPIVTALLIAGAAGSAICADLGSRKIRDEIDAMEVMGIDPLHRLVVPRVLACALVGLFLNGLVSCVGIAGGYVFNVMLQGGTPGAYLSSFSALAQLPDLWQAEVKALMFGITAALVASYKGLTAGGGPKGVGDAVNQTVVISFMLLFLENFIVSSIYLQVVPQKSI
jgi:phospholipid/cholesterol/gamma-HCH transport system permease protein